MKNNNPGVSISRFILITEELARLDSWAFYCLQNGDNSFVHPQTQFGHVSVRVYFNILDKLWDIYIPDIATRARAEVCLKGQSILSSQCALEALEEL